MKPVLTAVSVAKRFGTTEALIDGTVTLAAGEFVALLGPSGSGKTTLFRCLTRLIEPDAGQIHLDGRPIQHLKGARLRAARRQIGVVFQQFNLVRRRSALTNVLTGFLPDIPLWRVASGCYPAAALARAEAALGAVGLAAKAHQRADTLSGGQQQRVAIARALAQESRILLADEPVASLDPETAAQTLELLRELCRIRGLAVLCTLHQPQLAERYADRVIGMHAGRVLQRREV
ncbi:MAG: ATP-binding cassette domain-containing protein [Alphaproteobacteria bacterium]|nr:ATP-binding cassette domain-containing protein [Alphaproteobacteria bacterium]